MENLNVLITGASSGIGYELAKRFAKNSRNLVLVARNREKLEAVRSELSGGGATVTLIDKDLSHPGAAAEVYEEARSRNLRIDVLINCAGVGLYGKFHQCTQEEQVRMLQLNMVALTELTHLCAKDMVERGYGRILNVGSISSFVSTPMMTVYAATKAYVLSFSESLNSELSGRGDISVTALCPGFTKTNFAKEAKLGKLEAWVNRIAMSPSVVARQGYEALRNKKPIQTVGGRNVFLYLWIRWLPRPWLQKAATFAFKDRPAAAERID